MGHVVQTNLLYPSTQMPFPLGGERVTCHGSKLIRANKSHERPKETTTFDSHMIRSCTWKLRQICIPVGLMSRSLGIRATFLTKEGIRYSRICNSTKTYQSNKIWTFWVFKLLIWQKKKPGSPAFGNSLFDPCRYSPGRKIVVTSFTTKYACSSFANQTQNDRVKH